MAKAFADLIYFLAAFRVEALHAQKEINWNISASKPDTNLLPKWEIYRAIGIVNFTNKQSILANIFLQFAD